MTLDLEGAQVWLNQKPEIDIEIQPGKDHLIVIRRNNNTASFGQRYLTKPVEHSDQELI